MFDFDELNREGASTAASSADCTGTGRIEVAASAATWLGIWARATFDQVPLRGDALSWSGDEVRHFVAGGGQPSTDYVDAEDLPCAYIDGSTHWGASDSIDASSSSTAQPWWVEAQSHCDGPGDDESIPRKLEGWWHVLEFRRDPLCETGENLRAGELCYLEKLWSDRIRVFRQAPRALASGVVPLQRVCDLQLRRSRSECTGTRWEILRDYGEAGDDPDEIRVGQRRTLLGGEYGAKKLQGIECTVVGYVAWMDRWTVEVPFKDAKGKPMQLAVAPSQLQRPRLPRDPKPNGRVALELGLRHGALELDFCQERDSEGSPYGRGEGFRLSLRFESRVRPGGRSWEAHSNSMYRYHEVRFVASGDYGLVFRVLQLVDPSKQTSEGEEDPHRVLDVARGCDRAVVARAYRRLARRWHPDKVPEDQREIAEREFQRIHQAYENLLGDPERSSDLLVLKLQHPAPTRSSGKVSVAMAFQTEVKCLSLVSQLRLPNVAKLVEAGPGNEFIVTWPYVPEALLPSAESDGCGQVDRVDLVRQGWSDFSRSTRTAQQIVRTMMSLIRHDLMIVDPTQNIIVDRESGEPLFIDFGRGETAGSIYATRIKTFMKKILDLLVVSVCKSSFDVAARLIRNVEGTLYEELERWQDERTRDQKTALAVVASKTKWQEGIEQCRSVWNSHDDNAFRKMFKDAQGVFPRELRELRPPRPLDEHAARAGESDDEDKTQQNADDDPEGYCDADIDSLTPVQRLLRAKRKKNRREKLPRERPTCKISVTELNPDGKLGLGLDDAGEDQRGVVVVEVHKSVQKLGWLVGDRIVELNGKIIDDWDEFSQAWQQVKTFGTGAVFGVMRIGVEAPPEKKEEPKCLHCGSKGKHLLRCATWAGPLPEGDDCAHFCTRDCQKEAWRAFKRRGGA